MRIFTKYNTGVWDLSLTERTLAGRKDNSNGCKVRTACQWGHDWLPFVIERSPSTDVLIQSEILS